LDQSRGQGSGTALPGATQLDHYYSARRRLPLDSGRTVPGRRCRGVKLTKSAATHSCSRARTNSVRRLEINEVGDLSAPTAERASGWLFRPHERLVLSALQWKQTLVADGTTTACPRRGVQPTTPTSRSEQTGGVHDAARSVSSRHGRPRLCRRAAGRRCARIPLSRRGCPSNGNDRRAVVAPLQHERFSSSANRNSQTGASAEIDSKMLGASAVSR